MIVSGSTHTIIIRILATIAVLYLCTPDTKAQKDSTNIFYHPEKIIDYTHVKMKEAENIIEEHLNKKDSLYITPNKYKLTLMAQYTNAYEYYRFYSPDRKQNITFSPDINNKIGFYVGWKWLFFGWTFDVEKNNTKADWNFSFYTSKVGFDFFYMKRDEGFKIRSLGGFKNEDGNDLRITNNKFSGMSVTQKGFNVYYIFNNKHFSYPAAYSQTNNQRISCGSFILGLNYSEQNFHIDNNKFSNEILDAMNPNFKISSVKYKDYSINFGYTYNWVFAKNCLANISATPAIGYKNTSFKFALDKEFIKNINFDFIFRAALLYNNSRYFAGASLVSHTYSYRKANISIVNGFGTFNVYTGIYLFRDKKK